MMLKVLVLLVILNVVHGQFLISGHPSELHRFRSLKSMILACQKKFLCQITMPTGTTDALECIDAKRRCDGHMDCSNSADEAGCPTLCVDQVICPDKRTCAKPCDGTAQCPGHEDEKGCPTRCPGGQLLCEDKKHCAVTCDHIEQCPDGRDEHNCPIKCPWDQMQCLNKKKCANKCDGIMDCPDGEDETTCPFSCTCPKGTYLCKGDANICLPRRLVCNQVDDDCPMNDDESPCTG